jgi:hypothetical protein
MGLMFRSLKPSDTYYSGWRRLQQLRRPARRLVVGTIGAALLLSLFALFSVVFITLASILITLAGIVFVLGMFAGMAAFIRSMMWRCPRCGKRFYWSWMTAFRPWRDECAHCGLPEYAPCDPAEQQWETIDVRHSLSS